MLLFNYFYQLCIETRSVWPLLISSKYIIYNLAMRQFDLHRGPVNLNLVDAKPPCNSNKIRFPLTHFFSHFSLTNSNPTSLNLFSLSFEGLVCRVLLYRVWCFFSVFVAVILSIAPLLYRLSLFMFHLQLVNFRFLSYQNKQVLHHQTCSLAFCIQFVMTNFDKSRVMS